MRTEQPLHDTLFTPGDFIFCFDCKDWHSVPVSLLGKPWKHAVEHGYQVARSCDIAEAVECMEAGQHFTAPGYLLAWIHAPEVGFLGFEMKHVEILPGIDCFEGTRKFGPFTRDEMFRHARDHGHSAWLPWNPELHK